MLQSDQIEMTNFSDIKIPPAFPKMGTWLNYRLDSLWKPGQNIVNFAISHVDDREKRQIRSSLKKALAADLSQDELETLWSFGETNILIPDEREFRDYIGWIITEIDAAVGPN